ncbi:MAG: CDP-diacylglycerol--glycerol-3-phosphate 3-phosphatidyltransferase [Rhodothermales bacterium]|jgi:CDP-diacylglycerol--glycerol-3-phosphate 3-phosphatidyltransferase
MNLPNKLTLGRVVIMMVVVALASIPPDLLEKSHLLPWRICYVLAIIAGFTDFLDGYIARKYKLVTDFGKLMDPLADKIFTIGGFIILSFYHLVPHWITIILLTRELAVTGLRSLAAGKGRVLAAANIGKAKTFFQMIMLLIGGAIWCELITLDGMLASAWPWMLAALAGYTAWTGVVYFYHNRDLYIHEM